MVRVFHTPSFSQGPFHTFLGFTQHSKADTEADGVSHRHTHKYCTNRGTHKYIVTDRGTHKYGTNLDAYIGTHHGIAYEFPVGNKRSSYEVTNRVPNWYHHRIRIVLLTN